MEDEILQRVLEGGGRDYYQSSSSTSPPSPPASASSSILQSLPLHVSFDHGYYLLVKAIQELRDKKDGHIVTVGIGGPSGSGKTSLAEKVESVLGCLVISMENYRTGTDEGNDLDSIDFDSLVRNLQDLIKGRNTEMPLFHFQEKKRLGLKQLKVPSSGVVIVDGAYALHSTLRSLLDIRVAVVGGVHFSLLSKVRHDIGDSCSLDYLIDSIFPLFRKHIEPDLHHAQIRINNSFVSSFREPYYKLKCKSEDPVTRHGVQDEFDMAPFSYLLTLSPYCRKERLLLLLGPPVHLPEIRFVIMARPLALALQKSPNGNTSYSIGGNEAETENFIEMYLRPPFTCEEAKINDWIKVRQSGIRYYLSLGDQRIVDKNFIIRPKAEFEVGRTTLGGLLALGYNVVVSYKRACTSFYNGQIVIAIESIDTLNKTFMVLKGTSRKVIGSEASRLGLNGPWITKSYLEMILESKGVPRLNTPPPASSNVLTGSQDRTIAVPRPIRLSSSILPKVEDLTQPWTRSPTKSDMEPVLPRWHFISDSSAFRGNLRLAPMPDSYDLDRGLLLSVQAIQALLENNGFPVIVGIGGPSGSGKTSLAQKMANIVGCEVISLESYYKAEQVKDFKYDEFTSLDLSLLSKNIDDIRKHHKAKVPCFDFEKSRRNGFKELQVSEDSGVVIFEGVYALHPDIRKSLDLWIAVVGGVHSHLIARVQRDKNRVGCSLSQNDIMTTVFPMFHQHIEPHLVHAHLKIRNDFDPVLSPESSLFVLKSNKQVPDEDLLRILDPGKVCTSVQNFIDVYLRLPGIHANGHLVEGDCIRVRICEGRFALLIREPIREGNFILQPKVDFDISVSTVAGLLKLGYRAVAYIEASAFIYQDGKILIEVDHLQAAPSPFLQIKGTNKEVVSVAASILNLDGSYTTKSYLQIILESLPEFGRNSDGIHNQQALRLQELVEFIQSQAGSLSSEITTKEILSRDAILEDLNYRIRKLERWNTVNMVFWTILMSALVGYSLYQRKRH